MQSLVRGRHRLRWLSPIFGGAGLPERGATSPFIAGLWLEIVFSALVFPPAGTLLVTAMAAAALWWLEALSARADLGQRIWLQTGFVAVIWTVTSLESKRWALAERRLSLRAADLGCRLHDLEGELDDVRQLGRVGEGTARSPTV